MSQDLIEALRAAGLPRLAEPLAERTQPAIRLLTAPADQDALRAGATRFGGAPHLSPDAPWPTRDGHPLAFLVQIDLRDFRKLPAAAELPAEGLLQFFFDTQASPSGLDPADRGGALVRFEPSRSGTVARRSPTGFDAFPACAVAKLPETSLPPPNSPLLEELRPTEQEAANYAKFWSELEAAAQTDGLPQHRLLGHASPLRGDMQLDCQLASHGIRCGRPEAYADPSAAALALGAPDWRLLQIDTDQAAGTMFGERGRLYFWIPDDALTG